MKDHPTCTINAKHQRFIIVHGDDEFAEYTANVRFPNLLYKTVEENAHVFTVGQKKLYEELVNSLQNNDPLPLPSQVLYKETSMKEIMHTTNKKKRQIFSLTLKQRQEELEHWNELFLSSKYKNQRWKQSYWLIFEFYFYRLLLEYSGYFESGYDPYLVSKEAELATCTPWNLLNQTMNKLKEIKEKLNSRPEEGLMWLLQCCLWGNKADLNYVEVSSTMSGPNASIHMDPSLLLIDDTSKFVNHLDLSSKHCLNVSKLRRIVFLNDNAASELLLDLLLVDYLLSHNYCDEVIFYVKVLPTYVSDATVLDVYNTIEMLADRPEDTLVALGQQMQNYLENERFHIRSHIFSNFCSFYWEMPNDLQTELESAMVTIIKGDLNYRRLIGDYMFPVDMSMQQVVSYFPSSCLCLRTLKSYPLIGLTLEKEKLLEKEDKEWRINGKRGIIQGYFKTLLS